MKAKYIGYGAIVLFLAAITDAADAISPAGNLVMNPGFESGLTSWDTTGAVAYWFVDRDFTPQGDGVGAVAVSTGTQPNAQINQCVAVTPGKAYAFSAWSTAYCTGNAQLSIVWTTNDCMTERGSVDSPTSTTVGDWQQLRVGGAVPAGASAALAKLENANNCNEVVFFDDVSLTLDTIFSDNFEATTKLL